MATDPLLEFIKTERSKGVSDETIRIMLTSNGWSSHEIGQAFLYLDDAPPVPMYAAKSQSKKRLYWIVSIIVVVLIIVWLLVR